MTNIQSKSMIPFFQFIEKSAIRTYLSFTGIGISIAYPLSLYRRILHNNWHITQQLE